MKRLKRFIGLRSLSGGFLKTLLGVLDFILRQFQADFIGWQRLNDDAQTVFLARIDEVFPT